MIGYRKISNLFVSELRCAQKRYFADLGYKLSAGQIDAHNWRSLAKKACGWSSRTLALPPLVVNDALITEPQQKAAVFAAHFQSQCSATQSADVAVVSRLLPLPSCTAHFELKTVSQTAVADKLRRLPSWKSCGPDGVTNHLLKLSAEEVAAPLSSIFNKSLVEGIFPACWKDAAISPVPKEGKDLSQPVSYRPIALLCSPAKVLEDIVRDQLLSFCIEQGVIPDSQFGFLKGRSTEWQLLSVIEEWHTALDRRSCVHAVFLDAAKAFDRVDHTVLLSHLAQIGVVGTSLEWFRSYLTGRRIRVKVQGSLSELLPITAGVPQGSILGPLLFLIYFKDIPSVVDAVCTLFADDTLLYRCDCAGSRKSPCCSLASDLVPLTSWADSSKVKFNALKSVELCLGAHPSSESVNLNAERIPRQSSTLHLGVVLSHDLKWKEHISRILQRASGPVYLCKRLAYQHSLPSGVLRKFFLAFVRPRLEYCSAVWGGASPCLVYRLEKLQLQVARAIARPRMPVAPSQLLASLGLPTLAWRRRIRRLVIFFKLHIGQGPPQLRKMLSNPASLRSTRALRSAHGYAFPSSSTARHLSSFLCTTIPEWNKLPASVVMCTTVSSFTSSLHILFSTDKFSLGL